MSVAIFLPLALGMLACVAVAVVVIVVVASRRRADTNLPRCGSCGYNLTGAPSNRCPECGKLFIEAGVVVRQPHPTPYRRVIWVAVLILVGFTVSGVLGIIVMRMQVVASQQAAVQARMQVQAAAQQAATTAPAAEAGTTDQPPEAP